MDMKLSKKELIEHCLEENTDNEKLFKCLAVWQFEFYNCLAKWNDLPAYAYTEDYEEAFKIFIILKIKNGLEMNQIKNVVYSVLHHETGNRRPLFRFKGRTY